jgi:hypothetical protein
MLYVRSSLLLVISLLLFSFEFYFFQYVKELFTLPLFQGTCGGKRGE